MPRKSRIDPAVTGSSPCPLAGQTDLNTVPGVVAEYAELFPNAEFVIQPGAGHFPWLDDPDRFVAATATFLA